MADAEPLQTPTIVIAIDGLRASALGAYGQTAYETPALDAFAAESETHEWRYATTPDPTDLYRRLSEQLPPVTLLATDEPAVTALLAERSGRVENVTLDAPTDGAAAIAETFQASLWQRYAELLVECANKSDTESTPFAWFHTRGLYGPWDAPTDLVEAQLDDDDPDVATSIDPPDESFDDASSTEACDARFAAASRYAAQVIVIDACLGGFLEVVEAAFEGRELCVAILGLSGFPLGEHGRVGGRDDRLFSEQQHTPLLVRSGDPATRFTRDDTPGAVENALAASLCGSEPAQPPFVMTSASGCRAVRTSDWFLRSPASGDRVELYVKPDDRWEQNDVASLDESACDQLLALLDAPDSDDSGMAGLGASK